MSPLLKLIDNDMNTLYHRLNRLNRLSSLTAQTAGTAQAVETVHSEREVVYTINKGKTIAREKDKQLYE